MAHGNTADWAHKGDVEAGSKTMCFILDGPQVKTASSGLISPEDCRGICGHGGTRKKKNCASAGRSIKKDFDQNSSLQVECDTSITRVSDPPANIGVNMTKTVSLVLRMETVHQHCGEQNQTAV